MIYIKVMFFSDTYLRAVYVHLPILVKNSQDKMNTDLVNTNSEIDTVRNILQFIVNQVDRDYLINQNKDETFCKQTSHNDKISNNECKDEKKQTMIMN